MLGLGLSFAKQTAKVFSFVRDQLKLLYRFYDNSPELLLSGATSFDGTDDYINATVFDIDLSESWSFSVWFNCDDASGSTNCIFSNSKTSNDRLALSINTNRLSFTTYNGSATTGSSGTVSSGIWTHAFATLVNNNLQLYINGVAQTGTASFGQNATANFRIGSRPNGDSLFGGKIANVGIWNRALSSSEIESIYWKGQYADLKNTELTNLVSWYNLSADANDSTGTNNGTNNGATFLTDAYSASSPFLPRIQDKASDTIANYGEVFGGNAVSFDGTNDYISVADSSSLDVSTNDFSVSAWFKKDTTKNQRIVDKRDATGYTFYIDDSDLARLELNDGSGYAIYTLSSAISSGTWHHIFLSADRSGNAICYLNGTLVGTADISAKSNSLDSSSALIIGADAPSANNLFFDGLMSGVKIFNTALTQDQARELYTKPELTLPTGIASSALKLDMPMQEGSGVAILDGSGNQNHGTGSGITWANGQEYGFQHPLVRSNNPMRFETSDYVTVPKNAGTQISTGTYSVSVWIKPEGGTDSGTNYEIIDAESYNNNGWLIRLTGTDLKPYVRQNQASTATALSSTTAVTNGVWSHLVYTFASGTGKWYINGSLINSGSITAPVLGTTDMQIGGRTAQYFDGFINELSIWDSALTANEITALYNSGLPLLPTADSGNYASADDLAGYWRNDGVTTWLDKANTGVASFDGVNDNLNLDGFNFSGNQATFSFWVNLNTIETTFLIDLNPNRFIIGLSDPDTHLGVYDGSSWKFFGALSAGVWSHLVIVLNNTTASAYVNGSQLGSNQTITAINVASASDCVIGANYPPNNYYIDGKLASTNIFNTALSATEVSELYAIDKRSSISGFSQFSNCVGSWLMGAGTGDTTSTIQDQTSNNNDATVSGANLIGYNDGTVSGDPASIIVPEGLNEGRDSQGYYLTDTDSISSGIRLKGAEYISVQDSESLDFGTSDFSIALWVKPNENISATRGLIYKGADGSDEGYYLRVDSTKKIRWKLNDGSTDVSDLTTQTISQDVWTYITFVADRSGNGQIYLNGVLDSDSVSSISSVGDITSTENLYIGQYNTTSEFNGSIDEVKIYDKALSATEVLKNYNNGKSAH